MNFLEQMWQFFKNSFFFLAIIALFTLGLYGARLPTQTPEIAIDNWQVSAFSSGIAIYQHQDKNFFYTISPLNDFYIDPDNNHIPLLSTQDFEAEKFETNLKLSQLDQIILGIKNYFIPTPISYNFKNSHTVNYTATPDDNSLLINKKIILDNKIQAISLGTTLNFYENDYLFTPKGDLLTNKSASEINLFEQNFSLPLSLTEVEGNRHQILEKKIIIHNPNLPGFLLIQAPEESFLWVDNENKLIEIYYPIQGEGKLSINKFSITAIDSLKNL